jgi:hypothetical protein
MKPQVDLPVWEWLRFAPSATAAGNCTCMDESSGGRFIYYVDAANFWRYDTQTDAWQRLAGPPIPVLTASSMRYSSYGGYRGRVISADATHVTIAGLHGTRFVGKTLRITEGTGLGQERVISAAADPIIMDFGCASVGSATSISDIQASPLTKKWIPNQWRGYQCRIVQATGVSQVRKILYNTVDTLVFALDALQPYDHWSNTGFSAVAPYAVPAAGTHYYIEAQTLTVPTWSTTPDATSKFLIQTGAVWLVSGRTTTNGCASMQYYDVATDVWHTKMCASGMMSALLTGDVAIERTGERGGLLDTGTVASATSKTLTCTGKTWTTDQWVGFMVVVTDTGTGLVQRSTIIGNTAATVYIDDTAWELNTPVNPNTFVIQGNHRDIWISGNNQSALYKYLVERDTWVDGWHYDDGVTADLSVRFGKQVPWNYVGAVSTSGITSLHATPTNGGTGYKVGDVLNITEATGGKVRVTSVDSVGKALTVALFDGYNTAGTYTPGTGKACTTYVYPVVFGSGTGLTVNIVSVGNVGRLTTSVQHNVIPGESVRLAGATVGDWNNSFTVTAAPTTTTIQIAAPNNTAPVAAYTNSGTQVVDPSKNWTPGEHIGKHVWIAINGINPNATATPVCARITANTATTLTIPSQTFTVGTYRYVIKNQKCFGGDTQERVAARDTIGWVTAGGLNSGTVLEDTTKAWAVNQWANYKLRVICGTGYDKGEVVITANTATTLTSAAWGFTPDATTKYEILDSCGNCTGTFGTTASLVDTTKNWPINYWANKRVRVNAGVDRYIETTILSNTATVLTVTAASFAGPTATTCYSILGNAVRQIGAQLMWNHGQTGAEKCRFLYAPIGGTSASAGGTTIDRYNINSSRWDYTIQTAPQAEIQALGTQWAYDNKDRIYCGGMGSRVFYLDLLTREVIAAGQSPYGHGAGVQGNRMEIAETVDGLKFLYIMRHTGTEFYRTLIFW